MSYKSFDTSKEIDITHVTYTFDKTRRGTFIHFFVSFTSEEILYVFEMKVGKRGIWTGQGFRHDGYSYTNLCPHCRRCDSSPCTSFKKFQNKSVNKLLSDEIMISELKKVRMRFLTDFGINIMKKIPKS